MFGLLKAFFGQPAQQFPNECELRLEPLHVTSKQRLRVFEGQEMLSRQSLDLPRVTLPRGITKVPSFSSGNAVYLVSLEQQTCDCADFSSKQRADFDKFNLSRWCKHLATEISPFYAPIQLDEWKRFLLLSGRGGPLGACKMFLKTTRPVIITSDGNFEWLTILAHTKKSGETIATASGPLQNYGWNTLENRWSHGKAPNGAREMRKYLPLLEASWSD
ncbi:MAG: hypothetical protein GY883_02485 [Shimia sp.]|nr:hypothetical protein [Shimia sp.]